MSFGMLSAISFICIDAAMAARPLPAAALPAADAAAIVALQEEAAAPADLAAPPAEDVAPVATTAPEGEYIPAGEAYDGPLAFEDLSDEAVVDKLVDYVEGLDTLTGDFSQISPSGTVSTGKFYLRRPGFLRFEYEPPTPLLIVANGGMVYVRDEALETTDSYPVGKTPLKFLLSKKIDFDDAKVIGVDRGIDNAAVTFASEKEETEGEITLIVKAPEMTLARWIVRDIEQGITVVTLTNVKEGERLANRLFEIPDAGGGFLKN